MKSCLKITDDEHSNSTSSSCSTEKAVGFGRIEFREYPIIMGNNPSVGEGVPVTIDWEYSNVYNLDVDSYELASNKSETCTAGSLCPRLTVTHRAHILLSLGYSMSDIVECTMEVLDAQQKRCDSVRNRKWDGFHSFLEVTRRALKKSGGRNSVSGSTTSNNNNNGNSSLINSSSRLELSAPVSSPPAIRIRARRRSSMSVESTTTSAPDEYGIGGTDKQMESGRIFRKLRGAPTRRRASLDLDNSQPNSDWALTA